MRGLVLGSASTVHDDAKMALRLFRPDAVFAVNDMIAQWPGRIDYACSLHAEKLPQWLQRRGEQQRYRPQVWTHFGATGLGRVSKIADRFAEDWKGSSGLFAAKVALNEGFTRIVLCGVPMTSEPHIPGVSAAGWNFKPWPEGQVNSYRAAWTARQDQLSPFVRSMSGWTMELLGKPDANWLATT